MQVIKDIISVVQQFNCGMTFVAPYQENAADFNKGYATVFQINNTPQTTVTERVYEDYLELWQVNAILVQFSFYRYISYEDNNTPDMVALKVKQLLNSYPAMQAFNKVGLDVGPTFGEIMVDAYWDSERNIYVHHAHFEVKFYRRDSHIIESGIFDNINIDKYLIIYRDTPAGGPVPTYGETYLPPEPWEPEPPAPEKPSGPVTWDDIQGKPPFGDLALLNRLDLSKLEGILNILNGGTGVARDKDTIFRGIYFDFMGVENRGYTLSDFILSMIDNNVISEGVVTGGIVTSEPGDYFYIEALPFATCAIKMLLKNRVIYIKVVNMRDNSKNSVATTQGDVLSNYINFKNWVLI